MSVVVAGANSGRPLLALGACVSVSSTKSWSAAARGAQRFFAAQAAASGQVCDLILFLELNRLVFI